MGEILTPVLVLSVMGGVFAFLLGIVSKLTYVPVDPKIEQIDEALPGVNCGACGYPGCAGCAAAIANGEAPINACVVGGQDTAEEIAQIMGTDAAGSVKMVASVKCQGNCDNTEQIYDYDGVQSCTVMTYQFGGSKSCSYGCVGCGDCEKVCDFDAIRIVNGLAVIDRNKCTSCMQCISTCPKKIIELVPYNDPAQVKCMNPEFGKDVKDACKVGCIGCGICARTAPEEFRLKDKLAYATYHSNWNQELAQQAAEKCPAKCIVINENYNSSDPIVTDESEVEDQEVLAV